MADADTSTARPAHQPSPLPAGWRTELWPLLLVGVGVLAFLGFVASFKNYSIPSASMLPTLRPGEYLVAQRFLLPFAGVPEAGDVVVFPLPRDPSVDYVKRVVAAGGDTVQMRGGVLLVNGAPVRQERLPDRTETVDGHRMVLQAWRETLPNGRSHVVLKTGVATRFNDTPAVHVPAGHLFVLGDNRDDSLDSRMPEAMGTAVGTIPAASVTARASLVFWSPDPGRIGTRLGRQAGADPQDAAGR